MKIMTLVDSLEWDVAYSIILCENLLSSRMGFFWNETLRKSNKMDSLVL